MINFQELRVGDYVIVENEGDRRRGVITNLNNNEKQICVDNGTQEFWYETNQVMPVFIDDELLQSLHFHRETNPDGTIKYMKGAFRMLVPKEEDFSRMELWYRDETRHITQPLSFHQLQNHYYEMTKVHLDDTNFD